jgi:hypothetical protein
MSEDTIESFMVDLVELIETWPKGWPDIDECYDAYNEFCLNWFEKYYTKERNYN